MLQQSLSKVLEDLRDFQIFLELPLESFEI